MSAARLRRTLVAGLRRKRFLNDREVEQVFLRVPREVFLPDVALEDVYRDAAILIKEQGGVGVSSSSQPAIMAIMLEMLDVRPGHRVLEIGAGSGYNAALLRELVGPGGQVTTIEIDAEVAQWARERLDTAGYTDVDVHEADGALGWPAGAPWDRIIATVGAADIAPAWVDQLHDGGILVLPLGIGPLQAVVSLERRGQRLVSRGVEPAGFIRMRGQMADQMGQYEVASGVYLVTESAETADRVSVLLRTSPLNESWAYGPRDGLFAFAVVSGSPVVALWSTNADIGFTGAAYGRLSQDGRGLAIVSDSTLGSRLLIYGDANAGADLQADEAHWVNVGKPGLRDFHIAAWPRGMAPQPGSGRLTYELPSWTLVIDWQTAGR